MPAARRPRDARLQRLFGRGTSALELGLCLAGLCLLLRAAPPEAWQQVVLDAGAGAEQVLHGTWSSRRLTGEDMDEAFSSLVVDDAPEANDTDGSNSSNTSTTIDAMTATGGKVNSKDDDGAILYAIELYWFCLSTGYLVAFTIVRHFFPVVSTFFTTSWAGSMRVPFDVPQTWFGWVKPTATISKMPDLWKLIGLDLAMALEFPELCLKVSLFVAGPMVLITCPINWYIDQGGEDLDFLSSLGTANLGKSDSPTPAISAMWWAHSVIVWIVVVVVCNLIAGAEKTFVDKRFEWLKSLPEPRATTLMVENIPLEYQSDAKLREIFSETLSDKEITSAHTVKRTDDLRKLIAKSDGMVQKRKSATFQNKSVASGDRVLVQETRTGDTHDAETYWAQQESELDGEIQAERQKVLQEAEQEGGVNTSTGFVTFSSQSSVAAAYSARVTRRTDEFIMSFPPDPEHVLWNNLGKNPLRQELMTALGYVAIFFLFFFFLGIITAIVSLSAELQKITELSWARGILQAIVGPLVYQTIVGFLPTIFRLIFQTFWVCPSEPYMQNLLYRWYFWFLYVFVLFMSVIGGNPVDKATALVKDPDTIPQEIAEKLPNVSNFYVSLIILQVSNHVLNMVRHMQVIKYLVCRTRHSKKDAKKMAEPEDQDFYGVGSRSARWINTMLLGLVYCQIQPLLLVFTAIHFIVCKFVYGYLIVFAEDRKSDVGGAIFQDQLWHLQLGLFTYIVLMTGYLAERSETIYPIPNCNVPVSPCIISFLSITYLVRSAWMMGHIDCQVLPRREVPEQAHRVLTVSYIQPELLEKKRAEDEEDWGASSDDVGSSEDDDADGSE